LKAAGALCGQPREVRGDEMGAGLDKRLRRKRALAFAQRSPGAAVDEEVQRRIRSARQIHIDGFDRRLAVGAGARRSEPCANPVTFGAIALDHF
jgi:hypothetical protein